MLEDGADPHVIETRVTHTKKSRSAFDGYNRGRQWEITCAEVAKLKIARRPAGQGEVIALPLAAGAAGGEAPRYSARYSSRNSEESERKIVEAAGVEPASENAFDRTSTRVGTPIEVSRPPAAAGLRARRVS